MMRWVCDISFLMMFSFPMRRRQNASKSIYPCYIILDLEVQCQTLVPVAADETYHTEAFWSKPLLSGL